ncbi:hypothetical protein PybrP1_008728 [[Pythium] brassicae (nom. inval.)]|nr:hypothetical protein PybrP1_008728 [[Pythium] brassicae (nom. inval.)]
MSSPPRGASRHSPAPALQLQSDTVVFQHAKLPSRQPPAFAASAARVRSGSGSGEGGGAWAADAAHSYAHYRDERASHEPRLSEYGGHRYHADGGFEGGDYDSSERERSAAFVAAQQRQPTPAASTPPRPVAPPPRTSDRGTGNPNAVVRMTVRVLKESERLGFGIRHDRHQKLRVSTLQGNSAAAKSPLRLGDILLSVNGIALDGLSFLEVIQHLKATKPGELVFRVERDLSVSPTHVYEYPATEPLETGDESTPAPPVVPSVDPLDVSKLDKSQRQAVNALLLEVQRQQTANAALEDKNNALRKRLQKMLIECDEVRVKASTEVAAGKEIARRAALQLEKELTAARAQLRLQDRGPSVARTDSIVSDLVACKAQLERAKRVEVDRSAQLSARFNMENRHADREAHRVREKLVSMFRVQLRQVAKRSANPAPPPLSAAAAASSKTPSVSVVYEGVRRLAFLKLFGFPHDLEQYASPDFYSLAQVHNSLEHDAFVDLFGNALSHEERPGLFFVATPPMDVAYDPNTERLSLVCGWAEQNAIRELARNFRF